MKLGEINVSVVQDLAETTAQLGGNPTPILEKYGIEAANLANPHLYISLSRFMRIGREAIDLLQKPWFGLLLGSNRHIGNIGLSGWAAITGPTISELLATRVKYYSLHSRNIRGIPSYYLSAKNRAPTCEFYSLAPYNRFNYFCVDYILSESLGYCQLATGRRDVAIQVEMEYQDLGMSERFEEFFQCPVIFGAKRNAITFLPEIAEAASLFTHPTSHQLAIELANRELASLNTGKGFCQHVTDVIVPLLTGQTPAIDDVAERLGMTSWTLRRRLIAENSSFKDLLDQNPQGLGYILCERQHTQFYGDLIHPWVFKSVCLPPSIQTLD